MNILGISCYFHDAAAALVRDGVLVAAAEEERFTRKKHDFDFPSHAIDFCLRQGGLTADDGADALRNRPDLLAYELPLEVPVDREADEVGIRPQKVLTANRKI